MATKTGGIVDRDADKAAEIALGLHGFDRGAAIGWLERDIIRSEEVALQEHEAARELALMRKMPEPTYRRPRNIAVLTKAIEKLRGGFVPAGRAA